MERRVQSGKPKRLLRIADKVHCGAATGLSRQPGPHCFPLRDRPARRFRDGASRPFRACPVDRVDKNNVSGNRLLPSIHLLDRALVRRAFKTGGRYARLGGAGPWPRSPRQCTWRKAIKARIPHRRARGRRTRGEQRQNQVPPGPRAACQLPKARPHAPLQRRETLQRAAGPCQARAPLPMAICSVAHSWAASLRADMTASRAEALVRSTSSISSRVIEPSSKRAMASS